MQGGMETVVDQEQRPPRILELSWGRMTVEGPGAGKGLVTGSVLLPLDSPIARGALQDQVNADLLAFLRS
jgi:hypothetical protein